MADPEVQYLNVVPKQSATGTEHSTNWGQKTETSHTGGGGGGPILDTETKNYLDAKVDAVKAQNDARFTDVISRLDAMHPATWWQNALLLMAAIGFVFAILAYASDRFDSGVSAMGAVEEAIDAQRELNAEQDGRLNRILDALEGKNGELEASPKGQD